MTNASPAAKRPGFLAGKTLIRDPVSVKYLRSFPKLPMIPVDKSSSHSHSSSTSGKRSKRKKKKKHKQTKLLHKIADQVQKIENVILANQEQANQPTYIVDSANNFYPLCLVWAPLPILSWFLPLVGHMGIANSKGVIYDFSDDYQVNIDNFAHGPPTKYYQLEVEQFEKGGATMEQFDSAVAELAEFYVKMRHSFFYNNCQELTAAVLTKIQYGGPEATHGQWEVFNMITFSSSYTSAYGFVRQWGPFLVILISLIVFVMVIALIVGGGGADDDALNNDQLTRNSWSAKSRLLSAPTV